MLNKLWFLLFSLIGAGVPYPLEGAVWRHRSSRGPNSFSFLRPMVEHSKWEGAECDLVNGSQGVCHFIRNCPSIRKNTRIRPGSFVRCGFDRFDEIICCPMENKSETPISSNFGGDSDVRWPEEENTDWNVKPRNPSISTTTTTAAPSPAPGDNDNALVERRASQECTKYSKSTQLSIVTHIINGESVTEGEFPHIGALGYPADEGLLSFDCGGTLISDQYVVTAAHCVVTQQRPSLVRMGTTKLEGDFDKADTDYNIEEIIIHPTYSRKLKYHDLALLKLAKPVTFSSSIFPACLNTNPEDPTTKLVVAGWGTTDVKRESKSNQLLKAYVNPFSITECNTTYMKRPSKKLPSGITTEQMCARDSTGGGRDTCTGDSGGPLQSPDNADGLYHLIGITSFSAGECATIPGVYIRISSYLDWIESVVWPSE